MAQCTKVLHPTRQSAEEHVERLKERGYPASTVYKCQHCPFWHVAKGEKRLRARRPSGIRDKTSPRSLAKHRRECESHSGWDSVEA